tara:strand:+ start:5479 stop:6198 length:720 start_codon:yes stop_codon:yes gene_type:complete
MNKILTILPVYNKEEFLERAIESVLQQTHQNKELVIIDDYSTDKSLEIAKSYEHLSNVIVLQNSENKGCYYTRNKGLEYFKDKEWDYFTIHDADDLSDINRFKEVLKYFDPNILGIKTSYIRVNRNHEPQPIPGGNTVDIYASEGIAFYSKKVFTLLGYFDNIRSSGDTDYWWRLEALCSKNPQYKVGISDEVLYYAVSHEDNLTKTDPISNRGNYYRKIQKDINQMIPNNNFYRDKFE